MTATRRLAAILAADVAGYSRLIGADEGGKRVQKDAAGKLDLSFEDLGEQALKINWSEDRDAQMAEWFKNELAPRQADV